MTIRRAARVLPFLATAILLTACGDERLHPTDSDPGIEPVLTGDAGLVTASAVLARQTPDLMSIPGVVGTGVAIDGKRPTIRVFTLNGNVRGIPDHVENVPVERVVTGLIMAGDVNNPTTRERPAPNGFSIGHPDITAGTFGALVRDADDVCYALSNNHVLANSNDAQIGDSALQPGPFDGGSDPSDAIGELADFQPISFSSNNQMDAAIAELFDAANATGSTPGSAYGAPGASPTSASLGMSVQKFGRTTGHTVGQVAETNVTVSVCYVAFGPFCQQAATFVNQFTVTDGSFSDGGDSGSLIVTNNGSKNPVGLLFAGSSTRTIANPIGPVFSRFGVAIETDPSRCANGTGEPPANDPPTAGFDWQATDLQVDFTDTSSDADGSVVSWSWDFGDGTGSSAENPSHTYAAEGDYTVTLTVTDDAGATDSDSQTVSVADGGPPPAGLSISLDAYKVKGEHTIDVSWIGATGNVDIYRNGAPIVTNTGVSPYTDATGNKGKGSYIYRVCETGGTSTCSDEATAAF